MHRIRVKNYFNLRNTNLKLKQGFYKLDKHQRILKE